jgi:hypothetical protein
MLSTPRGALLTAFCSFFLGCGSQDAPQPPESQSIEYELFPGTVQLGAPELASLSKVSADGVLEFRDPPTRLRSLERGEVLLGGVSESTPHGLLRIVLDTAEQDDGTLRVQTATAPVQAAFRRLRARVSAATDPFAEGMAFESTDVRPLRSGAFRLPGARPAFSIAGDLGDRQNYDILLFDGDDNIDTTNDQVRIDTTLGGGFEYELGLEVDWGAVERLPETLRDCLLSVAAPLMGELPSCNPADLAPELKLSFEVKPYLDARMAVSGAASVGFSEELDVGTILLPPFTVGPLVFLPTADIVATIEGSASARFSAEAHANIKTRTRVELSSKVENSKIVPFEVEESDAGAETPEVDLYAEARIKPGVRFALALYGVAGPYAKVSAVAALIADPLNDPCWDFRVGLETELGVIVKTPSLPGVGAIDFLDWSTGPLSLFEESVASGSCKVTEEGAHAPPGGGPSAETLQKPPFEPWAKLLGAPADGSDLASVLAYPTGFPFLLPSIDGRYVAGGGGALGVVKLDGEGNATWSRGVSPGMRAPLRSLGSVSSVDAGLVTLFRPTDSSAFTLVKLGQSGSLERTLSIALPDDCGAKAQALARDGADGFVVVGECPFLASAWLVHVSGSFEVKGSWLLSDSDESTVRVTPTALTRSGSELVMVGDLVRQGEYAGSLAFVARLDDDDALGRVSAFACPERLSLYPTAVIPSLEGSLTMVGDANGAGYLARIKADGELGFVSFPSLGGGIQSGFAPNAIVELPTTGLVMAATVSGLNDTPADIMVVGLDGAGRTLWGREYTLHGEDGLRAVGWPSALLTDDGGVLLSATAAEAGAGRLGASQILAMKVFARDGTLPDGDLVTSSEITPQVDDYVVEQRELLLVSAPLEATRVEVDLSWR